MPRQPLPVVVVELELPDSDVRYYADNPYADYTAGIQAEPRLGNEITFERRITTIFWGGGRSVAGLGAIELINTDGALDELLAQRWRDRPLRIWLGDDATDWGDMTLAASGLVDRIESIGESRLRLVVADSSAVFDRHIHTVLYSSGDQVGRYAPITIGFCLSVPPVRTEMVNLRFSVSYNANNIVQIVRDQGVQLTSGVQWSAYNTAPSFGFVMHVATAGRVVADSRGHYIGSTTFLPEGIDNCYRVLFGIAGFTAFSVGELSDLQNDLGNGFRVGYYIDGSVTYRAVLDAFADSYSGWWCVDRLGQFKTDRLKLPAGSPVLAIDEVNLKGQIEVEFDSAPGLSTIVASLRNWHVHGPQELAGSVRDTVLGAVLMKDFRLRHSFAVHEAYSSAEAAVGASRESPAASWVRDSAGPASAGVSTPDSDTGHGTAITNAAGANQEATRRAALWAGPRWWYRAPVELSIIEAATLDLHSVVSLTVIDRKTGLPRFELDGRLRRVIGVRGVLGKGLVHLTLWGDGPEPDKE